MAGLLRSARRRGSTFDDVRRRRREPLRAVSPDIKVRRRRLGRERRPQRRVLREQSREGRVRRRRGVRRIGRRVGRGVRRRRCGVRSRVGRGVRCRVRGRVRRRTRRRVRRRVRRRRRRGSRVRRRVRRSTAQRRRRRIGGGRGRGRWRGARERRPQFARLAGRHGEAPCPRRGRFASRGHVLVFGVFVSRRLRRYFGESDEGVEIVCEPYCAERRVGVEAKLVQAPFRRGLGGSARRFNVAPEGRGERVALACHERVRRALLRQPPLRARQRRARFDARAVRGPRGPL
mmetsp:Transcript_580/g.2072  ORF Transcript_580/g.2072 Transcript_580/m.2072 type:complete len:289 (-) Transcript_580:1479-2345(-)